MIAIGIDDTDIVGSPGTNQLARAIVADFGQRARLVRITRHQLLNDPRVPFTTQNGSASILIEPTGPLSIDEVRELCRRRMAAWYVEGSDPGLCVTDRVPDAFVEWGQRCKCELVEQREAYQIAERAGVVLEGLGGTCGGVIGALAALGLARTEDDGRLVMWQTWPDDLSGWVDAEQIIARDVHPIVQSTGERIATGKIHVRNHLRPNMVRGQAVLWVEAGAEPNSWNALKVQ